MTTEACPLKMIMGKKLMIVEFDSIGRLPHPDDNVAIAIRTLDAGTVIAFRGEQFPLSHTVLVGHRFAVRPILMGESLYSWGQPFGLATSDITPGTYICNQAALRELARHDIEFSPPELPNFTDAIPPFVFDEAGFTPAPAQTLYTDGRTFEGYARPDGRGVGTRNMIVLLGTSSLTAGFVRALETRLKGADDKYPNLDGIVAVAHTEGGHDNPNNRELLLRTLAGFMIHPNVGAVLAVDQGGEAVNNAALREYLTRRNYPIDELPHQFMSLSRSFTDDLDAAAGVVEGWLETANRTLRTPQSLSELKVALQCGGSDAFSGISGNPLAAWVAREVLLYGGSANLAETDELIGAEAYVLRRVRDRDTARKFVSFVERFKERVGWHGHTAGGNPSGGNVFRGLYNIYLKSLGASAKRHPDVRLDGVIDYGERMNEPGYYFMDSPGNDLESIAGQIASGCNMIFFVTGNGSITNFPFVPTIKIVTTTERYHLLPGEMDVNAGEYLDGRPMDELGAETLQLTIDVASGQRSAGERAGHAQVQIWRDWRQTGVVDLKVIGREDFTGEPLAVKAGGDVPDVRFTVYRRRGDYSADQVGLILPTSLCSGQIARMCAHQLNERELAGVSRFVALVHTEGCGSNFGNELHNTLLGYAAHPMVKAALLLEHGCEKTHNGYIRQLMDAAGIDPAQFGWASVQLDGGIDKVIHKMTNWFEAQLDAEPESELVEVGLDTARLGLMTQGEVTDGLAGKLADLTQWIVNAGGSVVVAENASVLRNATYIEAVLGEQPQRATLGYAQAIGKPGFHIVFTPSGQWGETLTGLGATGVDLILAHVAQRPMPTHPMIPVLQVSSDPNIDPAYQGDLDGVIAGWSSRQLLDLVVNSLGRNYRPRLSESDNTNFQITRGLLGVSL